MAAFVQGTGAQSVGSVASLSKAFASNVTAGNAIWCGGVASANTLGASATTDGLSNSYTRGVTVDATGVGGGAASGYYALNIAGGSCTVTLDPTGSDFVSLVIAEVSGVATSSAIDGTGTANANASTYTISSYTPASAGVAFAAFTQNEGTTTLTESGGGTLIYKNENITNAMPVLGEYKIVAAVNPGLAVALGSSRKGCGTGLNLKNAASQDTPELDGFSGNFAARQMQQLLAR